MRSATGHERWRRLPPVGSVSRAAGSSAARRAAPLRGAYMFDVDVDFQGIADRSHVPALVHAIRALAANRLLRLGERFAPRRIGRSYSCTTTSPATSTPSFELTRHFRVGAHRRLLSRAHGPERRRRHHSHRRGLSAGQPAWIRRGHEATRASACSRTTTRAIHKPVRGSGGLLVARYREYWDIDLKQFAFRQTGVRGAAVRAALQPEPRPRGPADPSCCRSRRRPTRCRCISSRRSAAATSCAASCRTGSGTTTRLNLIAEHRWHAFSLLDMALFADAGKGRPAQARRSTSHGLHYSGGIGFRVRGCVRPSSAGSTSRVRRKASG